MGECSLECISRVSPHISGAFRKHRDTYIVSRYSRVKAFFLSKIELASNLFPGPNNCIFDTVGHWLKSSEDEDEEGWYRESIIRCITDIPESCRPRYLQ